MSQPEDVKNSFDRFELLVALLLGLSAIGVAFCGLQNALWSGKQAEGYSESNTLTTQAAKEYNEKNSWVNADYTAIAQAKKLVLEGIDAKTETDRNRCYQLASYYYTDLVTDEAYQAMGLPAEDQGKDKAKADPAKSKREQLEAELLSAIPEEALLASLDVELHDKEAYFDALFAESEKLSKAAAQRFQEGREANERGDRFALAGMVFTVAMVIAGLGIVFKSRVRWGLLITGAIVFLGALAFTLTLPMTN